MKLPQGKFVMLAGIGSRLGTREGSWSVGVVYCGAIVLRMFAKYMCTSWNVDEQIMHYVGSLEFHSHEIMYNVAKVS